MRISKFPPSRYCGCVTAPVKFSGLCYVCFLHSFVCLLVCFLKVPNFLIKDAGDLSAWKLHNLFQEKLTNRAVIRRVSERSTGLNLVGHRMNSLSGQMSIWRRKQTEREMKLKKKHFDIAKQKRTLSLFVNELLIKREFSTLYQ